MAAASTLLIEAAVARVLLALGLGVAGSEVTRDVVKARNEEADKAKNTPLARVESQDKEKERCKKCPPDEGALALQPTAGWKPWTIEYQQRICRMPPAPAGYLSEWFFNEVQFDGFDPSQCLLKEAKARYDQFFDQWGGFDYLFQGKIFEKMTDEAILQNNAAIPKPPTQLQWNFMEPVSFRYMLEILSKIAPEIEILYTP